jgi:hypothetical protein
MEFVCVCVGGGVQYNTWFINKEHVEYNCNKKIEI